MAGTDSNQPGNAALRRFIMRHFGSDDLDAFCFDHFPEVRDEFALAMTKTQRTIALIEYCQRRSLMPALLANLKREWPREYEEAFPAAPPGKRPEAIQSAEPVRQGDDEVSPADAPVSGGEPSPDMPLIVDDDDAAEQFTHTRSGLVMVHIPAGAFLYGRDMRNMELPAFWLSRTSVTNELYARFVAETGHRPPRHWSGATPPRPIAQHPVVEVSAHDAVTYCEWAGLLLPTEEEWEKAARGTDGRIFPWGNAEPSGELCNFGNKVDPKAVQTTPVGNYSPQGDSPYGCADMAGNVLELTASRWKGHPFDGRFITRGGAFQSLKNAMQTTFRSHAAPGVGHKWIGFRAAMPFSGSGL